MMRIQMLENECWWSGVVDFGAEMPYDKASRSTIDLNTVIGICAGRALWNICGKESDYN